MQRQNELLEQMHETLMGSFVQQTRLYDLFAAVGAGASEDAIHALIAAHAEGVIDTGPPLIKQWGAGFDEEEE